jgi:spore maturation protein CgeB
VRYPADARALLRSRGIDYAGWLQNHRVPEAFARARATLHVPRGPYAQALPGIPTIRVFEALACGIPLICSPWADEEGLFPPGAYLKAAKGEDMGAALRSVLDDAALARELSANGVRIIEGAHSCRQRVEELLAIVGAISPVARRAASLEAIAEREAVL